jgi:uncharacterized membrane protein
MLIQNPIPSSAIADFDDGPEMLVIFYSVVAILGVVIHALFALWVYDDACRLVEQSRNPRALVTRPWVWLLSTLIGGLLTMAVYWAIHRSMLSPRVVRELDDDGEEEVEDPAARIAAIKKKARRRMRQRAHSSDAEPQQPDSTTES